MTRMKELRSRSGMGSESFASILNPDPAVIVPVQLSRAQKQCFLKQAPQVMMQVTINSLAWHAISDCAGWSEIIRFKIRSAFIMSKRGPDPSDAADVQPPVAKARVTGKKKPVAALQKLAQEAATELHHPTLQHLDTELSRPAVKEWLQSMRGKTVESLAGYEKYDETKFQSAIRTIGEYTCLVNAQEIAPLSVTHRGLVPSLSSCERVKETIWARDQPLIWQEVVYVAVFSQQKKPDVLTPLNGDVARMAFWHFGCTHVQSHPIDR